MTMGGQIPTEKHYRSLASKPYKLFLTICPHSIGEVRMCIYNWNGLEFTW